jgi:hypothetical protein
MTERKQASSALGRLRVAFMLIGVVLLTPIGVLVWKAEQRLDAQRQMRHQMVADRVFDELERELSLLVERESNRPAYGATPDTDPEAWAPFIVGYFTVRAGRQGDIIASPELSRERLARIQEAVDRWAQSQPPPAQELDDEAIAPSPTPAMLEEHKQRRAPSPATKNDEAAQVGSPSSGSKQKAIATSPEILRQLNRGSVQRQSKPTPKKQEAADPLRDYSDL